MNKNVENSRDFLTLRFAKTHNIQRTPKHHHFVPINKESMQIFQVSKISSEKKNSIMKLLYGKREAKSETSLTTDDIAGSC